MQHFSPFFLVLALSLFSSTVFRLFHLPWVVILILTGILTGPQGLGLLPESEVISFAADTGLVFLMFMGGLESSFSSLKEYRKEVFVLSLVNGLLPFLVGLGVGHLFGFPLITSLLIGIIFVSSSIAVVIPSLEAAGMLHTKLGRSVMATSVIQDIASMVLLSIFLQTENRVANIPPVLFYPFLLLVLVGLKYAVPKAQRFFASLAGQEVFAQQVSALFVILFGTVVAFEALGLHPIIAGFFAGIILSDSITSELLVGKLRAIGYGIFVPVFFVVVGTQTDILVFRQAQQALPLTLAIVASSMVAKFISGTLGARLVGFNLNQAAFFGASSIPQLSTTLAATFVAASLDLIPTTLVTAMVILSVVTTLTGPSLMTLFKSLVLTKKDINTNQP